MVHTSVEMVNPGGTGRPAFVISARPEPLPPKVSFIVRSPSALPLPKKYTNFEGFELPPSLKLRRTAVALAEAGLALGFAGCEPDFGAGRFASFFLAMNETTPLRSRTL